MNGHDLVVGIAHSMAPILATILGSIFLVGVLVGFLFTHFVM